MSKRNILVYLLLAAVWLALVCLQYAEHQSFRKANQQALQRHARDLSNSLGVVIRSQRRFGTVPKNRLEGALQGLAEADEVLGINLFNPQGGSIAKAGEPMDPALGQAAPGIPIWKDDTLTVVELAVFGPEPTAGHEGQTASTLLVEQGPPPPGGGPPRGGDPNSPSAGNAAGAPAGGAPSLQNQTDRPPSGQDPDMMPPPPAEGESREGTADGQDGEGRGWSDRGRHRPNWTPEMRERFRKWAEAAKRGQRPSYPPWMSEEEYQELFKEQGLHKLAFRLSARDVNLAVRSDLRQRFFLSFIGLIAVGGLALLYRQMSRSSQLALQLVRAEAMNNHLRELNLAAAGLAHETRNPLNVVRGLAQLLADHPEDTAKSRQTSARIVDEVDRVSNRLNEFIAYSKPREPVLAPVDLGALVGELGKTLSTDCEEQHAKLLNDVPAVEIRADEGLLRQVLFNILINALQAIPDGGTVRVSAEEASDGSLCLRVADDGPGVPADIRGDVFRPYVSARDKGTGLGLAVVHQIAVAHHWRVECGTSLDLGGAEFSICGIQMTQTS